VITIDLEVEDEAWRLSLPNVESLAQTAARAALAEAGREANLVILLTGDDEVHDLNLRFRAQDKATNVLSFPAPENPEGHLAIWPWPTGSAFGKRWPRTSSWPIICNIL